MSLTHICSQGIQWTPVEFFDNSIICNLIENVSCLPSAGILGFQLPTHNPNWDFSGLG